MITTDQKERNFRDIIHDEAQKQNCVFFEDVENGREVETDTLIAWDMFGWLIPKDKADEFRPVWTSGSTEAWEEFLVSEKFDISGGQCTVVFNSI